MSQAYIGTQQKKMLIEYEYELCTWSINSKIVNNNQLIYTFNKLKYIMYPDQLLKKTVVFFGR